MKYPMHREKERKVCTECRRGRHSCCMSLACICDAPECSGNDLIKEAR